MINAPKKPSSHPAHLAAGGRCRDGRVEGCFGKRSDLFSFAKALSFQHISFPTWTGTDSLNTLASECYSNENTRQEAVVVFALFVSSFVFGLVGLALAIPLAASPQILMSRLWF